MKFLNMRIIIFIVVIINTGWTQNWDDYLNNDWQRAKSEINVQTFAISTGWIAGMYLLSYSDEYLNSNIKQINTGILNNYFKTIDYLGYGPVSYSAAIGITGLSFAGNDSKFRAAALTSFESLVLSSLAVYAIKISIGRKRPDENKGPRSFEPFQGWDDSFPSGHTSNTFALLTPWIFYYKTPLTYALLLLPISTGIGRMILNRHWATDVLTGAAIGTVVSYFLVKWHKDYKSDQKLNHITPKFSFSIPL